MNIELTDGLFAIIDESDFDLIRRYDWQAKREHGNIYAVVRNRLTRMHRLILSAKPGQTIDHINGNGLDNRRENLRFCTLHENQGNRKIDKDKNIPFKGVSWKKDKKKFVATIGNGGKKIHLGYFDCPFKAARAYDEAAKVNFGDFANLNFK